MLWRQALKSNQLKSDKLNAMTKEQIIELIKSQEAYFYKNLQECKTIYGSENNHTRYAAGAWGTIFELLQTIEQNENN